jgi:plastocyanin
MKRILFPGILRCMAILVVLIIPKTMVASQTWQVTLGAQSKDASRQAMAFLPNELWIYEGDSITWTTKSGESHTVMFLAQTATTGAAAPGTTRPANGTAGLTGCAGGAQGGTSTTPSPATLVVTTGLTNCINSGPICDPTLQQTPLPSNCYGWTNGTTNTVETSYTVAFPNGGNFKLVCLIHADMTGVIHVRPNSDTLPHNQWFYKDAGRDQAHNLLEDEDRVGRDNDDQGDNSRHEVVTTGEVVATGGGKQFLTIMRFLPKTIHVHVNDTVEWTNLDPAAPHTVTFGIEPAIPTTLVGLDNPSDPDSDTDLHATITPLNTSVSSGFLVAAPQERVGLPQAPAGVRRLQVKFTFPGTFDYICALHDELGMKGKVVVHP